MSDEELQQFVCDHKFFSHMKTSVKKYTNIDEAVRLVHLSMAAVD